MVIDILFILALLAGGFGLSLATYRMFAVHNGWPMGALHRDKPLVPILIGVFTLIISLLFAAFRADFGGWAIIVGAVGFAILWTGLFRVASQISLFLAPITMTLLILGWIGVRVPSDVVYIPGYSTSSTSAPVEIRRAPITEGRLRAGERVRDGATR